MYKQSVVTNPQTFLKTINTIHTALLTGLILFCAVTLTITKNKALNTDPNNGDVFFYIVPSLIIVSSLLSTYLFSQQLQKAANEDTLNGKLKVYQTAFIMKCGLIEGPSMFGIVVFMLSGNLFYLLLAGVNIVYLALQKPTRSKIEDSLNLAFEDKMMFEER